MATDIRKYNFKAGLPQEFEVVNIGELYKAAANELTTIHRTGFYHIIWFQKGSPTHLVDFKPVKIKPNTILFLNKDTVQRFDNNGKFDGKAILFTESFFCKSEADTKFFRFVAESRLGLRVSRAPRCQLRKSFDKKKM